MIEVLKYSNISKIYVKDLFFYDPTKEPELEQICKDWGITYIPGSNRTHVYKYTGESFERKEITDDLCCKPYDLLFSQETLDKFESGNHDEVLFVTEDDKIQGVVHIVDYNNEFIYFETYKLMHQFEKNLRKLLARSGYTNEDFISWVKKESSTNRHYKSRYRRLCPKDENKLQEEVVKRRDCGPFQTFFLLEILHFACSKDILSNTTCQNVGSINNIRNWIAHAKDVTSKREINEAAGLDGPLYKMNDLRTFVNGLNDFFVAYEEVEFNLKELANSKLKVEFGEK